MRASTRAATAVALALTGALAAGSAELVNRGVCEGDGFRLEFTPAPSGQVMSAQGFTLSAVITPAPVRCPGDIAAPFGVLDGADTAEFIRRMELGAPDADLAEPWGVIDAADLVRYNAVQAAGCN